MNRCTDNQPGSMHHAACSYTPELASPMESPHIQAGAHLGVIEYVRGERGKGHISMAFWTARSRDEESLRIAERALARLGEWGPQGSDVEGQRGPDFGGLLGRLSLLPHPCCRLSSFP
jgi:hypothetical protein